MPKRRDLADYYLQTLAQEVARKHGYLSDYACNVNADKIAKLDALLEIFKDDPKLVEWIKILRQELLRSGEAMWFMQAGELTNLGAKLGSKIVEASWGEKSGSVNTEESS